MDIYMSKFSIQVPYKFQMYLNVLNKTNICLRSEDFNIVGQHKIVMFVVSWVCFFLGGVCFRFSRTLWKPISNAVLSDDVTSTKTISKWKTTYNNDDFLWLNGRQQGGLGHFAPSKKIRATLWWRIEIKKLARFVIATIRQRVSTVWGIYPLSDDVTTELTDLGGAIISDFNTSKNID